MAITRFKNSSIANKGPKYDNALAGLPYRPVIGTATDGGNGTSVSVAFTGNNVAGAGVTYTALSTPGSLTATGPASPITVTGLTSGTEYTFQVKAGNSLGDSAYSASSNSVTPAVPPSFESIATATGTGSNDTITFSSIPNTYQHLQIRFNGIATSSALGSIRIKVNDITTNVYSYHDLSGDGASVVASGAATQGLLYWATPYSTTNPLVGIIDIHDYASTTKYKTFRCFFGINQNNTTANDQTVLLGSGLYQETTAISSIAIRLTGTWGTASTVSLYGIKGA